MVNSKSKAIIGQSLIFIYLFLFPLGQLMRYDMEGLPFRLPLHATDLVVLFIFAYWILDNIKKQKIIKGNFANFLFVATFSLVLSVLAQEDEESFTVFLWGKSKFNFPDFEIITARSMTFWSSLAFPGQS